MLGFGNGSFDPKTLVIVETAFDEAWITLRTNGHDKIKTKSDQRTSTMHRTFGDGWRARPRANARRGPFGATSCDDVARIMFRNNGCLQKGSIRYLIRAASS